jgi:hypothetical protein
LDGTPHINGRPSDRGEESSEASVEGFEDSPTTPKIDKGKGKAEPEPEEPEKVLSPRIRINDSEGMGHRMRRLLRCRGLHPLIGKSFCGQRWET